MDAGDFHLDDRHLARQQQRRAADYPTADFLAREVARRMDEGLEYVLYQPQAILDLGCGQGSDFAQLAKRYPRASLFGLDRSPAMLARAPKTGLLDRLRRRGPAGLACADARALPFASGSLSMVWSNLLLQDFDHPDQVLSEVQRVLAVGGLLSFSTLGPDSLKELRDFLPAPAERRLHRFIDMHDLGDALVRAGFAEPVVDMEFLTLTYPSLDSLLRDLRLSGGANANVLRPRGLTGKRAWQQARERFAAGLQDGVRGVTIEVIHGHAWKSEPKQIEDGRSIVRFRPRPPSQP